MGLRGMFEERKQYKVLEKEAYEAEKIEVKKEKIDEGVDNAIVKGKAKARQTGLPGPRVSPETKKKAQTFVKKLGKGIQKAAEKASDQKKSEVNKTKSNKKKKVRSVKTKVEKTIDEKMNDYMFK